MVANLLALDLLNIISLVVFGKVYVDLCLGVGCGMTSDLGSESELETFSFKLVVREYAVH